MKALRQFLEASSRWIDCVAGAIVAMRGWFVKSRPVELIEESGGEFSLRIEGKTGSPARLEVGRIRIVDGKVVGAVPAALSDKLKACRAELILQPGRFMFRPLELPRRAGEFLDGIVRSQVDRLTPWSPAEAAFGWSPPADAGNDRIVVTVAATARALVTPLVEAVAALGADSIVVSTLASAPGSPAGAIKVLEHTVRGALEARRVRRALIMVLLGAGLFAGAAVTADVVVGDDLEARRTEVGQRIAARRIAAARRRRLAGFGPGGAGAAQARDPGERDRARGAVADSARPHLCHRAAHHRRQAAGRRRDPRRSLADPADRAILAVRPRDLLRPHHPLPDRAGRALSHRSPHRAGVRATHMSTETPLDKLFARYPALAVLGYAAIVVLLAVVGIGALADLYDRNQALAAATDMLDQIEGRKQPPGGAAIVAGAPAGSPFLEGQTVTVAGAALQQRITAAVGKVGGNVLSSQVDLTGTLSKEGFVSLVASCELDQPAVQQLLYDLEAGMPFLFVDQLVVQAPEGGTGAEAGGGKMRVLLGVSGQWQGAK